MVPKSMEWGASVWIQWYGMISTFTSTYHYVALHYRHTCTYVAATNMGAWGIYWVCNWQSIGVQTLWNNNSGEMVMYQKLMNFLNIIQTTVYPSKYWQLTWIPNIKKRIWVNIWWTKSFDTKTFSIRKDTSDNDQHLLVRSPLVWILSWSPQLAKPTLQ